MEITSKKFIVPAVLVLLSGLIFYYLGYQSAVSATESQVAKESIVEAVESAHKSAPDKQILVESVGLFDKVVGLQQQLLTLQEKYQRLKVLNEKNELSTYEEQEFAALPELLVDSIQKAPLDLIIPGIEKFTSIPNETVKNMPDQRAFVSRLAEVAIEGLVEEPTEEAKPRFGAVDFSKNAGSVAPQSVFSERDLVIFAEFDSYNFQKKEVLVKWYRIDDRKVLLFKLMNIQNNQRNYVWITNSAGFKSGNYRVEIYDISQTLPLLSSGSYFVSGN